MRTSRITAGVAIALLGAPYAAAPAYADGRSWTSSYDGAGRAVVSSDRQHITVCDLDQRDVLRFKAEFATDNPIDPRVYKLVAPKGGCSEDRTYVSWIKVFKLCHGRDGFDGIVWEDCFQPIWPRP
ncbi:hypothetical protein GCM10010149_91540 [Nonomuraea roseoviolacea subsp. roseoviolacea]|uniref:hypothetical protein n=1 Tax=Nonomuraea roseoviolacea TaxID=103837 RepID=UPI0031DAF1C3